MFSSGKILNDADIVQIHKTSLRLLEDIGIKVEGEKGQQDFLAAGCKVDPETHRVHIPANIVESSLKLTPKSFDLYDSYGEKFATFGGDNVTYGTSGFAAFYLDRKTSKFKECNYEALTECCKLVEMLDEVKILQTSVQAADKPVQVQDMYMAKCAFVNSRKPLHINAFGALNAQGIIEMAAEVMGGIQVLEKKPHILFNVCTLSPLKIRQDACEVLEEAGKHMIPCFITAGPMAGATAPATLAGELAQAWAEVLAHVVLLQHYGEGCPIILASHSRIFDMKYGTCTVGTPEFALMRVGFTQLCKYFNVPSGGGGYLSDSNAIDAQYGWEKLMTGFLTTSAKQNAIWGFGMLSQLNVFSHEGLVLDCEILQTINRLMQGITVDEDHLAYDVIKEEHVACNFLGNEHTYEHYKDEFFIPMLTDRSLHPQESQDNNLRMRINERIDMLLEKHDYSDGNKIEPLLNKIIEKYFTLLKK